MGNLKDLHTKFSTKYPEEKISLTSFRLLRPQQCIPVGAKGTHNVCVCKIHGNIRLKLNGLKREFLKKKFDFTTKYRDYLKKIICSTPTDECYLENCKKCPGPKEVIEDLKENLRKCKIDSITFNQWVTTDRLN